MILLQWLVAYSDSCASYLQQGVAVASCDKDVHWVICLTEKTDKTVKCKEPHCQRFPLF